jgi:hypothetical protein
MEEGGREVMWMGCGHAVRDKKSKTVGEGVLTRAVFTDLNGLVDKPPNSPLREASYDLSRRK